MHDFIKISLCALGWGLAGNQNSSSIVLGQLSEVFITPMCKGRNLKLTQGPRASSWQT
jgi:hypothetical protein